MEAKAKEAEPPCFSIFNFNKCPWEDLSLKEMFKKSIKKIDIEDDENICEFNNDQDELYSSEEEDDENESKDKDKEIFIVSQHRESDYYPPFNNIMPYALQSNTKRASMKQPVLISDKGIIYFLLQ